MTPEQKARIEIDKKLTASGWLLQDKKEFNPAAALGVTAYYGEMTDKQRKLYEALGVTPPA